MARDFDGTGDYLYDYNSAVTAAPVTVSTWYLNDTVASSVNILGISDGNGNDYWVLWYNTTGDVINWTARDSGVNGTATTTTNISANTWHHICGVESSSNSRAVYLDGGNKGTDTTEKTPDLIDLMVLGALYVGSTLYSPMKGGLAETAIWNVALSDGEVAQLAAGANPLMVRPGNLLAYWPLGGIHGRHLNDMVGGYDVAEVGTVAWIAHPSGLIYPRHQIVVPAAAAAVTGNRRRRFFMGAA